MNKEQIAKITEFMKNNVWRNPEIMLMTDEDTTRIALSNLIDIATSLHNLLYKEVTGERYDYAFHWANKVGAWVNDDALNPIICPHYDKVCIDEEGCLKCSRCARKELMDNAET